VRGEIEDQVDERVDHAAGFEDLHAEVNQLSRAFAENLHAEQLLVVRAKNQFQQAGGFADDLSARIVRVFRARNTIFRKRLKDCDGRYLAVLQQKHEDERM
jgi:hypothetical protein